MYLDYSQLPIAWTAQAAVTWCEGSALDPAMASGLWHNYVFSPCFQILDVRKGSWYFNSLALE